MAEVATDVFIKDNVCVAEGIIVAGSADLKDLFVKRLFDVRLSEKIIAILTICYGGEAGFSEAIHQASGLLSSLQYCKERDAVVGLMDMLSQGTDLVVFGVDNCMRAVEAGFVERLLVSEDLPAHRHLLVKSVGTADTGSDQPSELAGTRVIHSSDSQLAEIPQGWEVGESLPLADWLLGMDIDTSDLRTDDEFERLISIRLMGTSIQFVSNASPETVQFSKGLGGIAGILRYAVDPNLLYNDGSDTEADDSFDGDDDGSSDGDVCCVGDDSSGDEEDVAPAPNDKVCGSLLAATAEADEQCKKETPEEEDAPTEASSARPPRRGRMSARATAFTPSWQLGTQ